MGDTAVEAAPEGNGTHAEKVTKTVIVSPSAASSDSEELTTATAEDILSQKILRQVEYYFGDANLPNDKFIKAESAKNEGWFPLTALLTFNRIQTLLTGYAQQDRAQRIILALRPSILIDIDEKEENIRRSLEMPLPDGNAYDRTVYLKGFHRTDTKLDDLLEHYSVNEGVDAIIMRYYKEKVVLPAKPAEGEAEETNGKAEPALAEMANVGYIRKFKGSILIIFKTVELANKFLKEGNHTYAGVKLEVMLQPDYRKKKTEEYQQRQAAKKGKSEAGGGDNADGGVDEDISDYPKGALIKILDIPEGFSRETVKEKFFSLAKEEDFPIAFVDFQRGDTEGVLRLEKEGAAEEAVKLFPDAKLPMGDDKLCPLVLFNEEDEKTYLIKVKEERAKLKRRFGGGNRGGNRGRGGKRGRHGGNRGGGRRGRR